MVFRKGEKIQQHGIGIKILLKVIILPTSCLDLMSQDFINDGILEVYKTVKKENSCDLINELNMTNVQQIHQQQQ